MSPTWGHCGLDGAQEGGGLLELDFKISELPFISQQLTQVCPQMGSVSLLYKWDCQLNLNEYIRHARVERDSM